MIRIRATLYIGGSWNNGANDGLFTFNVNNGASNSNWNIGFRLANNKFLSESRRRVIKNLCPGTYILGDGFLS